MSRERWQKIEELYHAALERDPRERSAFVAEASGGDAELRREVESLLASYAQASSFIEKPVMEEAARLIADEQTRSLVGRQIGHYKILSLIGTGGMGEVYLAQDTRLGRQIAIKVLLSSFTTDPDRVRRFQQEARAASALNHPNILTVHEIGQVDSRYFIATEFINGMTLRDLMTGHAPGISEALDIAAQVASALTAAHAKGIVHRDVKPENIMVDAEGHVKVLDFGLAKQTAGHAADPEAPTKAMVSTTPGMVMGTVSYMSPEQARGLEVDARTDIWSLGVMLYGMVAGRLPFEGETTSDVIAAILKTEPPPLSGGYSEEVSAELNSIVTKALRKEKEERYQSVKDLLADLRSLKEELEFRTKLERAVTVDSDRYAAFLINRGAHADQPPPQRALSRLTFDSGLQSEPTWSPDGRFIAYSSNRGSSFNIWVRQVSGGDPVQVTHSLAHDYQPDWSPDGNSIVFRSERAGGGLFMIPALGGRERKVSPFGYLPRWSPDSSRILFLTSALQDLFEVPKVYLATTDGNPPRQILAEFLGEFYVLRSVAWHPDGRRVSFWGEHRLAGTSFWTVPLAGGTPLKSEAAPRVVQGLEEVAVELRNFRWAPSGRALYFEGNARGVGNLWKITVDPETLNWIMGPERLTTGLGRDTNVALSPDGKKLAFTPRVESTRVWSLPFDAASGEVKGSGQPVTASGVDALFPELSRAGDKLFFIGSRAGTEKEELWVKSLKDGRETLLAADDYHRANLRLSHDGTRLAYRRYRSIDPGRTGFQSSIVLLPVEGGDEQLLTSPAQTLEEPSAWSDDGQWVLGSSNRHNTERYCIILLPTSASPCAETEMRVIASDPEHHLWQPRLSPNKRWICFNAQKITEPGVSNLYVVPAPGGEWTRIAEESYWADKPRWSPDGRIIYFVSNRSTGFLNVWGVRFDPEQGKPMGEAFQVTDFKDPGQVVSPLIQQLEISLADNRLVLPIVEVSGSIWLLENVDT